MPLELNSYSKNDNFSQAISNNESGNPIGNQSESSSTEQVPSGHIENINENSSDSKPKLQETMAEDLILHILDYIPLKDISSVRLLNNEFSKVGKEITVSRLQGLGVKGDSFEELTKETMQFYKDSNQILAKHQAMRSQMRVLELNGATQTEVRYLPFNKDTTYNFTLRENLVKNQLINSCGIAPFELVHGFDLNRGNIGFLVPIKPHRENIQWQLNNLTSSRHHPSSYADVQKSLNSIIQQLESKELNGEQEAWVSYIPAVDPTAPNPSIYNEIFDQENGSLDEQFSRSISGVGANKGLKVGIDLEKAKIRLKASPGLIKKAIIKSNEIIKNHVEEQKEKVFNL